MAPVKGQVDLVGRHQLDRKRGQDTARRDQGAAAPFQQIDAQTRVAVHDGVQELTDCVGKPIGGQAARIIAALAVHPVLHTAKVEHMAAISRDTTERLLSRMEAMGLVREITGARRFR